VKSPTGTTSSSGTASTARQWLRAMQVVGVLLVVTGVVAVANRAAAQEPFPLDKYPGLGRSPAAAQRDDTIAAWEAFRREQVIASCLAKSGFDHVPAVAFPPDPLAAVARSLGVTDASSAGPSPREQNAAYEAALSPEAREQYTRAMYGESATDIEQTWRTGLVPPGRESDFATGGCVGESNAAVPSVWALQRGLDTELKVHRQEIATSAEMVATGDAYSACARRAGGISARGPADIERIAVTDASRSSVVAAVIKQCSQIWAVGYRKAEFAAARSFEQRNIAVLRAAEERYRDVMKTISADTAFRTYLAQYGHR
jgi:hypothetical protein